MLVAFISDIHGNLPALEAALTDARVRGAEKIYCAGDLTGYGPFPGEVCRVLAGEKITSIIGNYDAKVIATLHRSADLKESLKPGKWKILEWACRHIDDDAQRFLSSLPSLHRETLAGRFELLMVHGSPVSVDDAIYPSITPYGLKKKLAGARLDILVCGHTHIPFARRVAGALVVNCGSAGLPVDGDPRPAYALVQMEPGKPPSARIIRFDYPKAGLFRAIERSSLPRGLSAEFSEGNKKREMP
ncbi:MAG: metallophosphoesterase family protein [Deltaproteobacteria bacterium]|nr:metallophosphoesterase family protein [Deltaproteobacteria bacterium]